MTVLPVQTLCVILLIRSLGKVQGPTIDAESQKTSAWLHIVSGLGEDPWLIAKPCIKTNKKPNNDIPDAANIEMATKVSKKVRRKALEILHAGGFIYKENETSRQFKFNNEYEKYKPDDERVLRKLEIEIDKKCKIN